MPNKTQNDFENNKAPRNLSWIGNSVIISLIVFCLVNIVIGQFQKLQRPVLHKEMFKTSKKYFPELELVAC